MQPKQMWANLAVKDVERTHEFYKASMGGEIANLSQGNEIIFTLSADSREEVVQWARANHVAWLIGSLVQQRYAIASDLGIDKKQQANELFKDYQGIRDGVTYPSFSTFLEDWKMISPLLREALATVSDEKLDSPFETEPEMQMTYYDMVAFSTYSEANQIGQIALYRRLLGYDAMRYEGM